MNQLRSLNMKLSCVAILICGTSCGRKESADECNSQLRSIYKSIILYKEIKGTFPPPYTVDGNNRVHSWRSLILPITDYGAGGKYNFKEPWNSNENSKLSHEIMPLYICPEIMSNIKFKDQLNNTCYVMIYGNKSKELIAICECENSGINWTEPRDFAYNDLQFNRESPNRPPSSIETEGPGIIFRDGRLIRTNNLQTIKNYCEFIITKYNIN